MRLLLVTVACVFVCGCLLAQVPVPAPAVPGSGVTIAPVPMQNMPLQPGDIVTVTVAGEPQVSGTYTVRDDGRIIFVLLGEQQASGFTATQLADRLTNALRPYVVRPVVAVTVVSAMPRMVSILGDCPRAGTYDQRQAPTLLALLALAGVSPDMDLSQAKLIRAGEVVPLAAAPGALPSDMALKPGDVVTVTTNAAAMVHVAGAVKTAGALPLATTGTAGKAALLAGTLPDSDLSRAYILRGQTQVPADLSGLAAPGTGTPAAEVNLQSGDVLMIPQKDQTSIYLLGDVKTPGAQAVARPTHVTAALATAGGLLDTADAERAYVLRNGTRVPVDLQALLQQGTTQDDPLLQTGDVLVVPKVTGTIYLMGEIAKPGPQPLSMADSVVTAWSLAGGVTADGDLRNVLLLRGEKAERLDLSALDRGDVRCDVKLQDGDRLLVPKLAQQVYVLGQVNTPGVYRIQPGDTLLDVIARAGGPTGAAAIESIAIVRRVGPGAMPPPGVKPESWKKPATDPADKLQQMMERGLKVDFLNLARIQPNKDVYLAQANDLVYVPALRAKRMDWLQVLLTLGTALLIGNN